MYFHILSFQRQVYGFILSLLDIIYVSYLDEKGLSIVLIKAEVSESLEKYYYLLHMALNSSRVLFVASYTLSISTSQIIFSFNF